MNLIWALAAMLTLTFISFSVHRSLFLVRHPSRTHWRAIGGQHDCSRHSRRLYGKAGLGIPSLQGRDRLYEVRNWIRGPAVIIDGATRFLFIVLGIYKQIKAQEEPVMFEVDEDNFDRAFQFLRPGAYCTPAYYASYSYPLRSHPGGC